MYSTETGLELEYVLATQVLPICMQSDKNKRAFAYQGGMDEVDVVLIQSRSELDPPRCPEAAKRRIRKVKS